jgi:hypothetical protein
MYTDWPFSTIQHQHDSTATTATATAAAPPAPKEEAKENEAESEAEGEKQHPLAGSAHSSFSGGGSDSDGFEVVGQRCVSRCHHSCFSVCVPPLLTCSTP